MHSIATFKKMDPHCLVVGPTEVPFPAVTAANLKKPEAIFIQALPTNGAVIVVSLTGVAADGSAGGYTLSPGANILMSINDLSVLRAISASSNQKLSVVYLAQPN